MAQLAHGDITTAESTYARAIDEFGAEEGKAVGAVDGLENLLRKGQQTEAARMILETYWSLR